MKKKRHVATASRAASNADRAQKAATATAPALLLADVERSTNGFHRSRLIGCGRAPLRRVRGGARGRGQAHRMHPHLVLGAAGGRRFPPAVPPQPDLAALVGVSRAPASVLLVDHAPGGAAGLGAVLFGATSALARSPPPPRARWPTCTWTDASAHMQNVLSSAFVTGTPPPQGSPTTGWPASSTTAAIRAWRRTCICSARCSSSC
ncbi:hypothetical protein PR202_gb03415 [Eleusine coracana subsp. coracana]|uniref:Uncharacterized protein n=1 Tax=Eleusine coracana subsp. coracana TaxID=191504 RepID=A0AAV5E0W1_ELECO|nr:hypothetical protein PR202_gb03415 [Eleusine coracana subsp. coracana]